MLRTIDILLQYGNGKYNTLITSLLEATDQLAPKTFTIKCDYCDEKVENVTSIPEGWASGRMNIRPPDSILEPIFVPIPTMCPYHKSVMHQMTEK